MTGELRPPVFRPATVVEAGTTLASALAVMDRDGVRHLPVVVDDGCLVGIVAVSDALRALAAEGGRPGGGRR